MTPIQRWFGLKQYILLRALGHEGGGGMGIDQLLWATTVASGNCECSIPVLVSCDWDGLDREEKDGEGAGMGGRWGGASCKGYSAPGSKGVACSVRFQTASTEKVRGGRVGKRGGWSTFVVFDCGDHVCRVLRADEILCCSRDFFRHRWRI